MLRIDQLRLLPGEPEAALLSKCARLLRTDPSALTGLTVLRRAIDAREGLTFVYTVAVSAPQEAALLRRCRDKRVIWSMSVPTWGSASVRMLSGAPQDTSSSIMKRCRTSRVPVFRGKRFTPSPPGRSFWRWVTAPGIPLRCSGSGALGTPRKKSPMRCAGAQ